MHSVESPARATLSDGNVQDTDKSTFADSLAHTGSHISSPQCLPGNIARSAEPSGPR